MQIKPPFPIHFSPYILVANTAFSFAIAAKAGCYFDGRYPIYISFYLADVDTANREIRHDGNEHNVSSRY